MKSCVLMLIVVLFVVSSTKAQDGVQQDPIPAYCYDRKDNYICKKKFKVLISQTKWYNALSNCPKDHKPEIAALASITNEEEEIDMERAIAASVVRVGLNETFWLSGTDRMDKRRFVWKTSDTTSSPVVYTNWHHTQPSNDEDKNCMYIGSDYRWYNANCKESRGYICHYYVKRS